MRDKHVNHPLADPIIGSSVAINNGTCNHHWRRLLTMFVYDALDSSTVEERFVIMLVVVVVVVVAFIRKRQSKPLMMMMMMMARSVRCA